MHTRSLYTHPTHMHTLAHTHTHAHTCAHSHTHMHTLTHTCTHTHTPWVGIRRPVPIHSFTHHLEYGLLGSKLFTLPVANMPACLPFLSTFGWSSEVFLGHRYIFWVKYLSPLSLTLRLGPFNNNDSSSSTLMAMGSLTEPSKMLVANNRKVTQCQQM